MANRLTDATERALLLMLTEVLAGNDDFLEGDISENVSCSSIVNFENIDLNKLISVAKSHVVLPLMGDMLLKNGQAAAKWQCQPSSAPTEKFSLTDEQEKVIKKVCETTLVSSNRLLYLTDRCLKKLDEAGIDALVLKGWSVAGYYPVPELRKSGDIDILVAEEDVERAAKVFACDGFREVEGSHSLHHAELINAEGIEIEVHNMLVEPFEKETVNEQVRKYGREMLEHTEIFEYNGYKIRRAEVPYNGLSLILHMLQHYMRAGFGIKLLCDWVVFMNKGMSVGDYKKFLQMTDELGISGFVKMINSVCHAYLGMSVPKGASVITDTGKLETFMSDLIEGEEFGRSNTDRMVVVHGKGLSAYFREFHHQMKLNNPKLSKVWILVPFLWIKTFVVFVKNNRKIRKTGTMDIIRNAGKRGKTVQEMELFKRQR